MAIASGVLFAGVVLAADAGLIHLYYKQPARQPLVYSSVVQEENDAPDAKGKMQKTTVQTEQTVTNHYKLVGPEVLAVKAQFSEFKTAVNGKQVAYTPPDKEAQKLIDVKGYRKMANKGAADFDKFDVILPNYPVKTGETWTYTAPPTTDLPVYLVTKFKLVGIEKLQGRDVAVIDAATHVSEVETARKLKITVSGKGRIVFAINEGYLVSSEFRIKMVTEPLQGAGAAATVTRNIKTNMKLVKLG
ncbi:MAG: hypothetical protein HY815_33210 [Candidatus Riflebacteria bacterium]|nr:hypothetical protein [Candidatus Riflebacteria bacterium]